MTAARRRNLHVAVNPGRWADHALRLGEFVAQWSRTATAHGRRLALDVRRARYPLLGGRVLGRLRQHHICLCEANERCNDQNGQAQKAIVTLVGEAKRNRIYCARAILDILEEPPAIAPGRSARRRRERPGI